MANRVFDCGVNRALTADIIVYPLVGDIGVPIIGFDTAINDNTRTVKRRLNVYPAGRLKAQLGVGVPYNAQNGVISN